MSQLRFDYTIRLRHDYNQQLIDMFIFCSRRMEAGARDTSYRGRIAIVIMALVLRGHSRLLPSNYVRS